MKEPKENSVGTPLPGCPTALPGIADSSGEVSLQVYLSLIVVTEGDACGAIPWILLGPPMVGSARFRGLPRACGPRNDVFFFRRPPTHHSWWYRDDREGRPYARHKNSPPA